MPPPHPYWTVSPGTHPPSQPNCADGVTAHVRTFLHGTARITISIASVAASEALPNEDKQQVGLGPDPRSTQHMQLAPLGT